MCLQRVGLDTCLPWRTILAAKAGQHLGNHVLVVFHLKPLRYFMRLLLLMIQAFFDESSDDPNEQAFIMAGWVSDETTWQSFSASWKLVLDAAPTIAYFKNNEATALKGQFGGWLPADRDKKVSALAFVVCAHHLAYAVVTTFQHSAYKKLLDGWVPPRRHLKSLPLIRSPYPLCFHTTVATVLQHEVKRGTKGQVNFVFDSRNDALDKCISQFRRQKFKIKTEAIRNMAGTMFAADDKLWAPLQAADLLAGQFLATIRANKNTAVLNALARHHTIFENEVKSSDLIKIQDALRLSGLVKDW